MASQHFLPTNNKENVLGHKLSTLPGKQMIGTLPNKGITRRPALTDVSTNREIQRVPQQKPMAVKREKSATAFRDIKPIVKTTAHIKPDQKFNIKPEQKVAIKQEHRVHIKQDNRVIIKPEHKVHVKHEKNVENFVSIKQEKIVDKQNAYSVQYFGLIEDNETDPLLVPVYINDIVFYLRNLEREYVVNEMYLTVHKTTPRMRVVLVNWLVEVHLNFRLVLETLHLCISIVDRYLEKNKSISRENLQLVGISALFIASKYEETLSPEMEDMIYVCDDAFSRKKIIEMEQSILKTLNFKLGNPCSLHFLRRYSKVCNVGPENHVLAKYLLELALLEHRFSHILPSLLASAAICMSIQLLPVDNGDETMSKLVFASGYSQKIVGPIVKNLALTVLKMSENKYKYTAILNKYSSKSNYNISSRTELKHGLIKKLADIK